ncbi:MAG: SoxR reducing system RseC family protein [Oscillospiraceae bacterium]|nr:SoxR reducing system RseC family protein [Oscillospiraceae bacterium]
MEQRVLVRETFEDGTALVMHVRESACSGDCHKCSGCGAAKETILLKVKNPIGARRGDLVKLESETGPVLKAAAVLYMLPMLLFFVGYFVGDTLWQKGALMGCLAFAASIVLTVVYDRRLGKADKTIYTITGFVEKSFLNS